MRSCTRRWWCCRATDPRSGRGVPGRRHREDGGAEFDPPVPVQRPTVGAEYGKGSDYNWSFDGNWHCAEWHVDGATQTYQFFYDTTEVQQIRIQNGAGNYGTGANRTDLPLSFSDLKVGWNNYQSAHPASSPGSTRSPSTPPASPATGDGAAEGRISKGYFLGGGGRPLMSKAVGPHS